MKFRLASAAVAALLVIILAARFFVFSPSGVEEPSYGPSDAQILKQVGAFPQDPKPGPATSPTTPPADPLADPSVATAPPTAPSASPAESTRPPPPTAEPSPSPSAAPTNIRVAIAGDVLLWGGVARQLDNKGHDGVIDPELAALMSGADLAFVNLEMPISEGGIPMDDKQYTFRGKPGHLSLLSETMGVSAVSLANNHSLDFGMDAFLDTLEHLSRAGIGYAGAGKDLDEAKEPWVAEVQGRTVAFLAASRVIPVYTWNATATRPGVLTTYDPANLNKAITKAKEKYDYVIAYIHWGEEGSEEPKDYQVTLARGYIDAGADAVFGTHPHILQGFEIYKDKPIAYSLGNFIFTSSRPETCVAVLNITDDDIWVEVVPCTIASPYTSLVKDPEKVKARLEKLARLSRGVRFDEKGRLMKLD